MHLNFRVFGLVITIGLVITMFVSYMDCQTINALFASAIGYLASIMAVLWGSTVSQKNWKIQLSEEDLPKLCFAGVVAAIMIVSMVFHLTRPIVQAAAGSCLVSLVFLYLAASLANNPPQEQEVNVIDEDR